MKQVLLISLLLIQTHMPLCEEQACSPAHVPHKVVYVDPALHDVQWRWARIVTGESSGQWHLGSELVAWTLRAWQLEKGMPAELAGPRWGWNGNRPPTQEAFDVVLSVWNQPLSKAPFEFMRNGYYCNLLGSDADVRYWQWLKIASTPNVRFVQPGGEYAMNCFFERWQ